MFAAARGILRGSPARGWQLPTISVGWVLGTATRALADGAVRDRPVRWDDWNGDIVLLLNVALVAWFYSRGWLALAERAGRRHPVSPVQAAAFGAGMLTLAVTLLSPLDRLSEQVAWAHMVQHVLLMTVAAPLLVLGSPWLVSFWGLSAPTRRALGRCWYRLGRWRSVWLLTWSPLAVWSLHMLVTWLWHAPALYEAALRRAWVHDLQHLCFLAAGCLYWRLLLDPLSRLRLIPAAGVLLLFTTTLHTMALSALMTLSPVPWYPAYAGSTELWELSLLEDQQLAGLIMWMPACLPYVAAALHLLAQSLAEPKAGDGMDRRAAYWRVPEEQ